MFGPSGVFARQAVAELMQRQSMSATFDDYLPGDKVEMMNILRRRMSLQDPSKVRSLRAVHFLR